MKRIGNLYEKVCSIENLQLADEKARKGKLRTYGVIEHDKKREVNLLKLRETLLNGTFHTSKYDVFTIYEPKEREIYRLPYFPDRILHHAIMNVLEPIWVSGDSCGREEGKTGPTGRPGRYYVLFEIGYSQVLPFD